MFGIVKRTRRESLAIGQTDRMWTTQSVVRGLRREVHKGKADNNRHITRSMLQDKASYFIVWADTKRC